MIMLYFSGTGNSKYVAKLFCQKMNAKYHSIEESLEFAQLIFSEDTIGFCYPIYGSRVPRLMREFVAVHIESLKDKKLIIFCTQMGGSGDGARVLTDLFPREYVKVICAEHFLMPNNVCNLFFLPLAGERLTKYYLKNTEKKMQAVCKNIKAGRIKKRGFNPVSRALGLIQGVFMPGIEERAMSKVWIDGDCNLCGLCVSKCPMGNFVSENDKISTNNNCMMCYRCINSCPQKAIQVFLRGKVKRQYNTGKY
jgi:ferredoxin